MIKFLTMGATGLLGMGLAALLPVDPQDGPPPPPHEAKKKGPGGPAGPEGDLRRAYDLLRNLRSADTPAGKPEERLRDLTDRATTIYRKAIEARTQGEEHASHEFGKAAHDLARTVDHARKASRLGTPDPELPAPPAGPGPEDPRARARRDLRHAYDRIRDVEAEDYGPETKFYLDAARDLYTAARNDAEANRDERAAELAKASEAITHVPEHLARALEDGPPPPREKGKKDRPEPPKAKKKKDGDRPEPPRAKRDHPEPDDELPPPIDK